MEVFWKNITSQKRNIARQYLQFVIHARTCYTVYITLLAQTMFYNCILESVDISLVNNTSFARI